MRFAYALMRDWPPLAWLARCSPTRPVVDVFHGPGVERTAEWFCEAVWAGAYETGGFDHTDVVFGSGGRLRNSTATFVSSGTTVDRLQSLETTDATWVSNSLPCLLAAVGESPIRPTARTSAISAPSSTGYGATGARWPRPPDGWP